MSSTTPPSAFNRWLLLLVCGLGGSREAHASVYSLSLFDTTGSQTFVNKTVGYSWDFYFPDTPYFDIVKATFDVKTGSGTTQSLDASLYRLDTNALVGSASLAAASVSNQFVIKDLVVINSTNFPSGYTFLSNVTYRLTLTSLADTGNDTWYINNPADALQATSSYSPSTLVFSSTARSFDPNTTSATAAAPTVSPSSPSSAPSGVPESGSTLPLVTLGAVAVMAAGRWRRTA